MRRSRLLIVLGVAALTTTAAVPGSGAEFAAGGYSFSDELGGFRLLSARGAGTPSDPIILVEAIDEIAPIALVVRRAPAGALPPGPTQLTLVKQVMNRSQRVWGGFEVALQEILRKPSTYADGLSFNQYGAKAPDVSSNAFADNNRIFEPDDRIRFERGYVDPGASASFRITITDPTPVAAFYVVQDPQILSAEGPRVANDFADAQAFTP